MSDQLAELDRAFGNVRSTLRTAAGSLALPNWQQHSAAVADSVEAAQLFFLHTTSDGVLHDPSERVFLRQEATVAGLYPGLMRPLIKLLRAQTTRLNKAYSSGDYLTPPGEQSAWNHWASDRLPYYESVLKEEEARGAYTPSERLWTEVTAPLLQGNFTGEHWKDRGIVNPGHRDQNGNWVVRPTRPDLGYPATVHFMTAEYNTDVSRLQAWLTENVSDIDVWLDETAGAARQWLEQAVDRVKTSVEDFVTPLVAKAKRYFFAGLAIAILIAVVYGLYRASSKPALAPSKPEPEL